MRPSQQFFNSNRNRGYSAADNATRPLKTAPSTSTLGRSTSFGALSSAPSDLTHTTNPIPLTPATTARNSGVASAASSASPRHADPAARSKTTFEFEGALYRCAYKRQSDEKPNTPPDIKQALPPSDTSILPRDDAESLASSSNTRVAQSASFHHLPRTNIRSPHVQPARAGEYYRGGRTHTRHAARIRSPYRRPTFKICALCPFFWKPVLITRKVSDLLFHEPCTQKSNFINPPSVVSTFTPAPISCRFFRGL